jgi:RNA polymerase-interacting CarD/CdnL/TRCF family regulator
MSNIIRIAEILEQKVRKEQELEYYEKELLELERKMFWLKKEIELTNTIIRAIENEEILDLVKSAESKIPILGKDDDADV